MKCILNNCKYTPLKLKQSYCKMLGINDNFIIKILNNVNKVKHLW